MKTITKNFCYVSEGIEAQSVEFTLTSGTIEKIEKAKTVLEQNPDFKAIKIDVSNLDAKQFDGCIEDAETKEITLESAWYFRTECEFIHVYKKGDCYLTLPGKYDPSIIAEVNFQV
jgi:hypothetical protein